MRQGVLRFLLLWLLAVVGNIYLLTVIDAEVQKKECFPYGTALSNFKDSRVAEETVEIFWEAADGDAEKFASYLAAYYAFDGTCTDVETLDLQIAYIKKYQYENFQKIEAKIEALMTDCVLFPVGEVANDMDAKVSFSDSWRESRTFGGDRVHEGTDIMATVDTPGIYPIYSASDGVVEKIGWLTLGGYRIGIRSANGVYFYYAHLSEYARDFAVGEEVSAGTLLGFMGDTGYSDVEGTTGNFPVHLHFGVYFTDEDGTEFAVNPYPLLKRLYGAGETEE